MDDGATRLAVPVGQDDHARGAASAPLTLVEYGDFQCPYCGTAYPVIRALEAKYGARLRVVFRHFPLEQHAFAQGAAEAAEFAADHGTFWEMFDALFTHEQALERADLERHATQLGLDAAALARALRDRTYAGIVEEQKEGGEDSGLPGTPAFFINGVLFEEEPTVEAFSEAFDWLLEHGGAEA